MARVARVRGGRALLVEVASLTPRLSSLWLYLVTPASVAVARPLVEGFRVLTVARDDRIWDLVGFNAQALTRRSFLRSSSTTDRRRAETRVFRDAV
jgi:hypothetical protein